MLTCIWARNPACDVACGNSTSPGNIGALTARFWFDGIEVERRPVAVLAVFFQFALRVHPLPLARAALDPAPFLDFLHALILPRWHPRSKTLPAAFGVLVVRTLSRCRPSMVPEAAAMDQVPINVNVCNLARGIRGVCPLTSFLWNTPFKSQYSCRTMSKPTAENSLGRVSTVHIACHHTERRCSRVGGRC